MSDPRVRERLILALQKRGKESEAYLRGIADGFITATEGTEAAQAELLRVIQTVMSAKSGTD